MITKQCAIAILFLFLPLTCAQAASTDKLPAQSELFNQAIEAVGWSADDVRIGREDLVLWGGNKYQINALDVLFDNPWKTSSYTRSLSDGFISNQANLGNLVTGAHKRLDCGVRLGLIGDPLEVYRDRTSLLDDEALATALNELCNRPFEAFYEGNAYEEYQKVPRDVRDAAALVLLAVPEILKYRDLGLTRPVSELGLNPGQVYRELLDFSVSTIEEEELGGGDGDIETILMIESLLDNTDWNLHHTGATLTAIAAQSALQYLLREDAQVPDDDFFYQVDTPYGAVVLSGSARHEYPAGDYLLIIDTGGADTYHGSAANRSYMNPVSITIDLQGADTYSNESDFEPAFGAGMFGYAVLIDNAGDDSYTTTYAGQGAGIFGTGILYDVSGNDEYHSFGNSQGSGTFGTGLLVDLDGEDRYTIYKYGQGYGFTKGCGILLDGKGNDSYYANMEDHFNGGLYGDNHHVHFVQGSAYGRRADFTDGHSWAGGFGMLCDGEGNDRYEGDCYCQGNSYWYSLGICVDKGGDDIHRVGQYSAGSAPHFSIGILQNDGGNDRYTVGIRQSMGHGRDWSLGWFEDSAGDDWYQGARSTFGCSSINSISVFWDWTGNDTYLAKGPTHGCAEMGATGGIRDWLIAFGIFVDGGGDDIYLKLPGDGSYDESNTFVGDIDDLDGLEPLEFADNGTIWTNTLPTDEIPGKAGCAIDAQ